MSSLGHTEVLGGATPFPLTLPTNTFLHMRNGLCFKPYGVIRGTVQHIYDRRGFRIKDCVLSYFQYISVHVGGCFFVTITTR